MATAEIVADQADSTLRGQAEIWNYMFSFADPMALKCAVELQLPDIIHSHSGPITLAQIASAIPDCPSPDLYILRRIMRLLVRRRIFTEHQSSDGSEVLYGPTHLSRWLLSKTTAPDQLTLAPFIMINHPWFIAPWDCLSRCVREGGIGFEKLHNGRQMWDMASENPEFNKIFNNAMECTARIIMRTVLSEYREGFAGLRSLVDVGGGTGGSISEIVRSHPQIKGITYDLPHVVATAPAYPGVSHVGGNMFEWVPKADAVLMKWILHDWSDEDCVKILRNCRKAIPEKGGKIIIVDVVLDPLGNGLFDDAAFGLDLGMIAQTGGVERTEEEWKKVLEEGGFPRYKVIKIPAFTSIIEAYPQ